MSASEISAKLLRYPLDLTGTSPDNFTEAEVCVLPNHKNRAVVLSNGPFFTESIRVWDHITGQELTKKVQFTAAQLVEPATVRAGKEICAVLIITDPSVSEQVRVNYQCVGGPYILNLDALNAMVDALDLDERPVVWGEIIGKPDLFPPGHHLHDAGDVFGFEYFVLALEEIRKAILMGDVASHDEIRAYISDVETRLGIELTDLSNLLNAHKLDLNNPHVTTKAQVGLGSVQNYGVATTAEAQAGTVTNKYMTPYLVAQAITTQAGALLQAHVNDKNNPHATTAAQVGLGSVQNYGVATQAEAEAGTVTNKYMTPLRVAQAITAQAGEALQTHIDDKNNPHAVTATQIGLGNVQNYAIATQAEAEVGTASNVYMTPQRVAQAIKVLGVDVINAILQPHITNTSNPHAVTKTQVGLGSVDNYPTATSAEITAKSSVNKFITAALLWSALDNFYNGLGGAAKLNVGTASNQVAAGNHTHSSLVNGTAWASLDAAGLLSASGDIGAPSDERLKTDFAPILHPLDLLERLEGCFYTTIRNGMRSIGLRAQNVQKVVPEAVRETEDGYLSVLYGNLSGLFVEGINAVSRTSRNQAQDIQTLNKRIETLEAELKNRLGE